MKHTHLVFLSFAVGSAFVLEKSFAIPIVSTMWKNQPADLQQIGANLKMLEFN